VPVGLPRTQPERAMGVDPARHGTAHRHRDRRPPTERPHMTRSAATDDPSAQGFGFADRLARELAANGSIRTTAWQQAFAHVPRHLFVSAFHVRTPRAPWPTPPRSPGWWEAIYSDETLITQFSSEGLATSSSTEPSLL